MSHLVNRFLILCGLSLAVSTGLSAQVLEQEHDHEHEAGIICGTAHFNTGQEWKMLENTARANPKLYEQMVHDAERAAKEGNRRGVLSAGSEKRFYVQNQATGQFDEVYGQLVFEGRLARLWVDLRDTGRTAVKNAIKGVARGLDTATGVNSRNPRKGIIENDQEVFGLPPVNQIDPESPVQDFLLTDIQDGMTSGGFVGGFFSPWDQSTREGSNQMNLLYIDSKEGLSGTSSLNALLSTVAHEFQHLIHFRTNRNSQTLYNEGCSEVASIILGYQDRKNTNYLKAGTNVPLFKWNYGNDTKLLIDYERAMTFVYYMYEQYGEPFLTQFVKTPSEGMTRISDALNAIGKNPDWQGTLMGYAVANYIGKDFNDSRFIYRNRLSTTVPKTSFSHTGPTAIPATGSAAMEAYGSTYAVYTNAGGLKIKFKASTTYSVSAILYKGSGIPVPVEVRKLENDRDYTLFYNSVEPYDKIVFVIANLNNSSQTASWTVEQGVAGVEEAIAETGGAGLSSIAPNPASGSARVTFSNANTGDISIQLYDTKGSLVRTVVDNTRYESGEHNVDVNTGGLADGVYMVRLMQDGHMTSRVLVVLNR